MPRRSPQGVDGHPTERLSLRRSPRINDREIPKDPVIEVYKKDIDKALLRKNLQLSLAERLQQLVELQRLAEEARTAARRPDNVT